MSFLGRVSRWLSRATGGEPGTTLCARAGIRWGHDCLFCKCVGFVLRDPRHCWDEMLIEFKRRAGK